MSQPKDSDLPTEPGWYPDPWQEGIERRFDGKSWTADCRLPEESRGWQRAAPERAVFGDAPRDAGAQHPEFSDDDVVADPYGEADADPYGQPPAQAGPVDDGLSPAQRMIHGQNNEAPGPSVGGLPWGRAQETPEGRATDAKIIRAFWVVLGLMALVFILGLIFRAF